MISETEEETKQRFINLTSTFNDLGKLYIQKAEEHNNPSVQTKIKHYIEATKFFNYAISIAKENQITETTAAEKIEYINIQLLQALGVPYISKKSARESAQIDKGELIDLRDLARKEIEQIGSLVDIEKIERTRALFETIAERMQGFLARIYQESEAILGTRPCSYSVMGLGSMALKTMTPYSDLEFAILTENDEYKNNPSTKDYFINLTQLVHFRIINLGETVIEASKLGDTVTDHLVRKGVSFDLGGKTPLGRGDKYYNLIATVNQFIEQYLDEEGYKTYVKRVNPTLSEEELKNRVDNKLPYQLESITKVYASGNANLILSYQEKVKN